MKKKKIALKISALVLALVLIGGVAWFAVGLVGNPLSYLLTYHAARDYMEMHHADTDYEMKYRGYDFKTGRYSVYVSSPTKIDEHFGVYFDSWGNLVNDGFDGIENKWNVASRLGMEYRNRVQAIFNSGVFPYETDIDYGDLAFDFEPDSPHADGAVKRSELENNRLYDIAALGRTNGELVLYVIDDDLSAENAAEILLTVRAVFDTAGLPFHHIDFVIRTPRDAEGKWRDSVRVESMLYTDIVEDGLVERVRASIQAAADRDNAEKS